ncbi:expressed unknown protein [Seminavis robusta]|uniref:Uncharacterized protein n=1 Tax=Seminavis robusta TaxID=568900 RepID=A0A9N8D8E1_9STRA|nr:expressed unknown protein [Seminavis robusta]|eukprot:Sro34_g021800.1 n/a (205) ;mRNA; r:11237-11851
MHTGTSEEHPAQDENEARAANRTYFHREDGPVDVNNGVAIAIQINEDEDETNSSRGDYPHPRNSSGVVIEMRSRSTVMDGSTGTTNAGVSNRRHSQESPNVIMEVPMAPDTPELSSPHDDNDDTTRVEAKETTPSAKPMLLASEWLILIGEVKTSRGGVSLSLSYIFEKLRFDSIRFVTFPSRLEFSHCILLFPSLRILELPLP